MGGSKGGGQRTPTTAPITLESAQRLKIVDLICEGIKDAAHPISGQDVFLNGTPLQNADGSYNFEGVEIYTLPGTADQDYLPGFESSDTVVSVGTEVKHDKPVTRAITDPQVDRLRVTLAVGGLESVNNEGDTLARAVQLSVSVSGNGQSYSQSVNIEGRTNATYHRDVVFDKLPPAPFNLTVSRITPDSNDNKVRDKTHFVSFVESIDAKINYPHSVVVGLKINSALFGGQVPTRTYRSYWQTVEIPDNYDPDTRTYAGVWNGTFKLAWTNNPAWIWRDLVTNERYGLAKYRDDVQVDKWALYAIARYCDEMVDDGFGGKEPRFTCNAYITDARDAYDVLTELASCFRGITFFDGLQQVAIQDSARDPVALYSNNNVVDGLFEYSGVSYKDIITSCVVKFADAKNSFLADSVEYTDDAAVARFGYNVKTLTAFGCTSRGQAMRAARWYVETSVRERESVSFKVGREGIRHLPYDVIRIADNDWAGAQLGARAEAVSGRRITLDRDIGGDAQQLMYLDTGGQERRMAVRSVSGRMIELTDEPQGLAAGLPVVLSFADVAPRLFRALGIAENDDGTYTISAVAHDPNKERVVDTGAEVIDRTPTTRHGKPQVYAPRLESDSTSLTLRWDAIGNDAVSYQVQLYRDGVLYQTYHTHERRLDLSGLPPGDWRAEIRAVDSSGALSDAVVQAWALNYDITALRATGKVFAIELNWQVPPYIITQAWTEIWYSATDDISSAQRLARLPYPAGQYTLSNVALNERFYFWARFVDVRGNIGAWTQSVMGEPSQDPTAILSVLEGKITNTQLHKDLADSLNKADGLVGDVEKAIKKADQALAAANLDETLMAGAATDYAGNDTVWAGTWTLHSAITDGDYANAKLIHAVQAEAQGNHAKALEKIETTANAQEASALRVDRIEATFNSPMAGSSSDFAGSNSSYAGAWSLMSAITDGDYAQAQQLEVVKAQLGEASASVTQTSKAIADLSGKASALYSVSVSATTPQGQPVIGGIAVGVDGQTASSEVLLQADKLMLWDSQKRPMFTFVGGKAGINGDLIVDGSILGQHIRANQTLRSPNIEGGNLNIGDGNFTVSNAGDIAIRRGDINLGNGIFTVDRNGNVTIKRGQINIGNGNFVVDANGHITAKTGTFEGNIYAQNLQGNILKAYEIHRENKGRFRRKIPRVERKSLIKVDFMIHEQFYAAAARCYFNGNLQTEYAGSAIYVKSIGDSEILAQSGNHQMTFEYIAEAGDEIDIFIDIYKSIDTRYRSEGFRDERNLIDPLNTITAIVIPLI